MLFQTKYTITFLAKITKEIIEIIASKTYIIFTFQTSNYLIWINWSETIDFFVLLIWNILSKNFRTNEFITCR